MNSDALDSLLILRQRLGRDPSYLELLAELGHPPAGMPVAGVNDPGYPVAPVVESAALGEVHGDDGLTALLREQDLREAHPDLEKTRQQLVQQLLFGGLGGGPQGLAALLGPANHQRGGPGHIRPGHHPLALP